MSAREKNTSKYNTIVPHSRSRGYGYKDVSPENERQGPSTPRKRKQSIDTSLEVRESGPFPRDVLVTADPWSVFQVPH